MTKVVAVDLNERGQVLGNGRAPDGSWEPFLVEPDGSSTRLGVWDAPWDSRSASALNAHGQVAGSDKFYASGGSAFVWTSGTRYPLPSPPACPELNGEADPYPYARAEDLNDPGLAAGFFSYGNCGTDALIWSQGFPTLLPGFEAARTVGSEWALAINDAGLAVGRATDRQQRTHAVAWKDGAIRDLGVLPTAFGAAVDVNAGGEIVIVTGAGAAHVLAADGVRRELSPLREGEHAMPRSINARGEVVGSSAPSPAAPPGLAPGTAVLWRGGEALELEEALEPGPVVGGLVTAVAITDDVRILVNSSLGRVYVLSPTVQCLRARP